MTATPEWNLSEPGAWELDAMHFPVPITLYHQEILKSEFPRGFGEGAKRVGLLLSHFDHAFVNGFDYTAPRIVGAPKNAKGPPPWPIFKLLTWMHPEIRARLATASRVFEDRPWRADVAEWTGKVRAESTRTHQGLQAKDPAKMDDPTLGAHLEELHRNAHHQYYLHHRFTVSVLVPLGNFIAQTVDWTGLDAGMVLQAVPHPEGLDTEPGRQFSAMIVAIRGDDSARKLVEAKETSETIMRNLREYAGPASAAIHTWMTFGAWRLVTGYDITDLVARELPDMAVRTIRAALDRKPAPEVARSQVREKVPEAKKAAFDALLDEARQVAALREERAMYCDFWAYGLVRRAVKEAGVRVAAKGRLADAMHLFDASHPEMLALLAGTGGPKADEVAARYAWRTSQTADIAPKALGLPRTGPPPLDWLPEGARAMNRAIDAAVSALFQEPPAGDDPRCVRGLNASQGTYEGVARVVRGPADFDRLQRGDVLVARSTTEAYNGILPLLGAVVTDRGGLLSHTATVAREYGIPAVVGTHVATRVIPDGARVKVDGTRGEARLQ